MIPTSEFPETPRKEFVQTLLDAKIVVTNPNAKIFLRLWIPEYL